MKAVKTRFKSLWYKGLINRYRNPAPFPGKSPVRWGITDPHTGTIKYEGKPSTQAAALARKLSDARKRPMQITWFDKLGPFVIGEITPLKFILVLTPNYAVWAKYYGKGEVLPYLKKKYGKSLRIELKKEAPRANIAFG